MKPRLLLDPAVETAGTVPPPPPPPPPPPQVSLAVADFQRLTAAERKLAEVEAENAKAIEAKDNERLLVLAQKGEAEKALTELRTAKDRAIADAQAEAATLRSEILKGHKDTAIARALAGVAWADEFADKHALALLEGQFEAVRDAAGNVTVRDKATLRPAADVVKEKLASPEFSRYLKPSTGGGTGAAGADQSGRPADPNRPLRADQVLVEGLKAQRAALPASTNPYAFDLSKAMSAN